MNTEKSLETPFDLRGESKNTDPSANLIKSSIDTINKIEEEMSIILDIEEPEKPTNLPIITTAILKKIFVTYIKKPEFKSYEYINLLNYYNPSDRPDFGLYPTLDRMNPLSDQLEIS
jgi:hypothetical protein